MSTPRRRLPAPRESSSSGFERWRRTLWPTDELSNRLRARNECLVGQAQAGEAAGVLILESSFAVLNPGGRDGIRTFTQGAGLPSDPGHPPVNYHGYAACCGGAFYRKTGEVPEPVSSVLVLVRKKGLGEAVDAVRRLRKRGKRVMISWKESGLATGGARVLGKPCCYREVSRALRGSRWLYFKHDRSCAPLWSSWMSSRRVCPDSISVGRTRLGFFRFDFPEAGHFHRHARIWRSLEKPLSCRQFDLQARPARYGDQYRRLERCALVAFDFPRLARRLRNASLCRLSPPGGAAQAGFPTRSQRRARPGRRRRALMRPAMRGWRWGDRQAGFSRPLRNEPVGGCRNHGGGASS